MFRQIPPNDSPHHNVGIAAFKRHGVADLATRPLRIAALLLALGICALLCSACEEHPCAMQLRLNCTCCSTESGKQNCTKYIETNFIPKISTTHTEEETKECRSRIKTFNCQNISETTINSYCTAQ